MLSAMPWCYDDPDHADQLQNILLSVFGGNTIENVTQHGTTRVAPIATANEHIIDELASRDDRLVTVVCYHFHLTLLYCVTDYFYRILCRVKLIPFLHEVKHDLTHTHVINHAFEMVHFHNLYT